MIHYESDYSVDVSSGVVEDDKYCFCIRFDNSSVLTDMTTAHLLVSGLSPGESVEVSSIRPPFVGNLVLVGSHRKPLLKNNSARSKIGYISNISSSGEITVEIGGHPDMMVTHKHDNRWSPINNTYSHLEDVLLRGISDTVIAETFNLPQEVFFKL